MPAVKKPNPVKRGPKWLRRAFAERDKYREALKAVAGKNVEITETASGTTIAQKDSGTT